MNHSNEPTASHVDRRRPWREISRWLVTGLTIALPIGLAILLLLGATLPTLYFVTAINGVALAIFLWKYRPTSAP